MAIIARYRSTWSGFPGAPGYTDLFSRNAAGAPVTASIRAFWDAIKAYLPAGTTIQVLGTQDLIDEATGNITGQSVGTPPAIVTSTGSGAFSGATGAVINWQTVTFLAGRRVRGRSFIVPLIATAYDTAGSLSTGAQGVLQAAASALVTATSPDFVVWHRPTAGAGGQAVSVTSAVVPDLAAVLRSRRT